MVVGALPARAKYAAGLFVAVGTVMVLVALVVTLVADRAGPPAAFQSVRGYDEGTGTDGYHFLYTIKGTGPGAEAAIQRGFAGVFGVGFIIFGIRLWRGLAVTVVPAAITAVLVGLGTGVASAKLSIAGSASIGLPGMGMGFVLVIGGLVLAAGRKEYLTFRGPLPTPPAKPQAQFAGFLLFGLGLTSIVLGFVRIGQMLVTVRGSSALSLRAEATASTNWKPLGQLMKVSAEASDTFHPAAGFFLHPQVLAVGWGVLHVWFAIGYFRNAWPRQVGVLLMALGGGVILIGAAFVAKAVPWLAATPDTIVPGALVTVLAGVLAWLAKPRTP